MENDAKQPNKVLIGIIIVVVLAAVTAGIVFFTREQDAGAPASDTANTNTPSNTSGSSNESTGSYKDGSYQANGNYQTPGGSEKVTVKVTLAKGIIESVELERDPTTREAEEYQGKFESGYKAQVVGKNIDEVRLSRVAGSSLTSGGFNQALESIKEEARA